MPLFGSHLSVAGGFHKAVEAALPLDMRAIQVFVSPPKQWPAKPPSDSDGAWQAKPITDTEVNQFRAALARSEIRRVVAHASYLINLASPSETTYRCSVEGLVAEMQRAEALGLDGLVVHPGAAVDCDEDTGLANILAAVDEIHRRCAMFRVRLLLETTAGQGRCLGHRFEHLARILENVRAPDRLGICLDTCHVFAAGYPLAPAKEYRATMRQFDRLIGLERLEAIHVNDSQKPLGSRVDRHAHIGQGLMGLEPFRLLVRDRRFRQMPMLLETPKEEIKGREMDEVNLATLRGLMSAAK